jgi:MFS transporter, NNP family, nitrate/nitrite transporter
VQVYQGIIFMGIMVLCMSVFVIPMYFPMWGGMIYPPREGATEEDYYLGEFSEEEQKAGLADAALKFAQARFSLPR